MQSSQRRNDEIPKEQALLVSNRHNIPAVCRIPDRGTAFLVAKGLLMTSAYCLHNKEDAATRTAIFFEGGKRELVEVQLQPDKFFFKSTFPENLDYVLVACDVHPRIFSVVPITVPFIAPGWVSVNEGDTVLVVQHPVYPTAESHNGTSTIEPAGFPGTASNNVFGNNARMPAEGTATGESYVPLQSNGTRGNSMLRPIETKRFEEIIRRRDDVFYLRASQNGHKTAGCPVFAAEGGVLVGLQCQQTEMVSGNTSAMTSRFISIVSIVKHIFATGHLSLLQPEAPSYNSAEESESSSTRFQEVWTTWYVKGDASRIVGILRNFSSRDIHYPTAVQLFEHACDPEKESLESIIACYGSRAMIDCLVRYPEDEEFTVHGLKALWNVSFDTADSRQDIADSGGIDAIIKALNRFPSSVGAAQFAIVLLYNLTLPPCPMAGVLGLVTGADGATSTDWAVEALRSAYAAMVTLPDVEVVQKFGIALFANMCSIFYEHRDSRPEDTGVEATERQKELEARCLGYRRVVIEDNMMAHSMEMLNKFHRNEYLTEHAVRLVSILAQTHEFQSSPALCCCVEPVINALKRFSHSNPIRTSGNNALWGLGNNPSNRVAIFTHPDGSDVLKNSSTLV